MTMGSINQSSTFIKSNTSIASSENKMKEIKLRLYDTNQQFQITEYAEILNQKDTDLQ